jgi:hypothetical protein
MNKIIQILGLLLNIYIIFLLISNNNNLKQLKKNDFSTNLFNSKNLKFT